MVYCLSKINQLPFLEKCISLDIDISESPSFKSKREMLKNLIPQLVEDDNDFHERLFGQHSLPNEKATAILYSWNLNKDIMKYINQSNESCLIANDIICAVEGNLRTLEKNFLDQTIIAYTETSIGEPNAPQKAAYSFLESFFFKHMSPQLENITTYKFEDLTTSTFFHSIINGIIVYNEQYAKNICDNHSLHDSYPTFLDHVKNSLSRLLDIHYRGLYPQELQDGVPDIYNHLYHSGLELKSNEYSFSFFNDNANSENLKINSADILIRYKFKERDLDIRRVTNTILLIHTLHAITKLKKKYSELKKTIRL